MARRYRRRKKLFRFRLKPKKQTVFSVIALLLVSLAAIITLSFFQSGSALDPIYNIVSRYFGWAAVLLPLVFVTTSFLLVKIKSSLTQPNVSFGMLLIYICIISLAQSGVIGQYIWDNFALSVSVIGAFILLSIMLFIGLVLLFNTSLDEIVKLCIYLYKQLQKTFKLLNLTKKKTVFVEKSPFKPPIQYSGATVKNTQQKAHLSDDAKASAAQQTALGTTIISNMPTEEGVWEYPPLSLLSPTPGEKADRGDMKQNANTIEKTLASFGITARVAEVNMGPAVTQYALDIALGTKLSKITALSNDLALALAAPTGLIRIEAPIPGRRLVGIEVPNRSLEFVTLHKMLSDDAMKKSRNKLLVALGLNVSGDPVTANISKMPHVLIAGTTGSGKSVLINSWISSLLFRTTPTEVKLILVDPKRVELTGYDGIPHLLTPVIVEPDKILSALKWATTEMDRRYKLFSAAGVRNIEGYNDLSGFQAIPYILILIDELADLMAYAPVEVEDSICRLAQMARATGIHLIIATQRPSVDVITGLIKANIPARIAFNVSSNVDSRVIIDGPGAEKLIGRGDMLYIPPDQAKPTRIQGTFVSDDEIKKVVGFLRNKKVPLQYTKEVTSMPKTWKKSGGGAPGTTDGHDDLFDEAVRVVCQYSRASASLLQRRLSIGYARAARILDQLELNGIVSSSEGSKPRDVMVKSAEEYFSNREATQAQSQSVE